MAKIENLIKSIPDAQLRDELAREVAKLKAGKKFGLVFEEHIPEQVQIPGLPVKPGLRVVKCGGKNNEVFKVVAPAGAGRFSLARELDGSEEIALAHDLVVIKKFGEPIYPTLTPVDRVTRVPGKQYHTLINADNFHALQLLEYTYAGKVDVIYIDPPYNTGARDWKYNNDYVDSTDQYRHSKWLSMMKKRLLLAKKLLSPDGVLICTIDEWEVFHLGILLEELFTSYQITSVVIVHNDRGTKSNNFAATHEYALFVIPEDKPLIGKRKLAKEEQGEWKLRMWGANSLRTDRKGMFHPIYVEDGKIVGIGEMPPADFHPKEPVYEEDGKLVFWPIDGQGIERRWRWKKSRIIDESRRLSVKEINGRKELFIRGEEQYYKTTWNDSRYDANTHGSRLVNEILLDTDFPFPKSLYAVMDCLSAACVNNPNALIVDFFAGSGTTLQATSLLNTTDNGNRRCILITNNEVEEKYAKLLNKKGLFPGDLEYEKHGICEAVTFRRCKFVLNGERDNGTKLTKTYINGRKMEQGFDENMEYFRLNFLDPDEITYGEKFEAILPILWLMADAWGERETANGASRWFIPVNSPFAVLMDETAFAEFKREIQNRVDITYVFLVTDSERAYHEMLASLPEISHTRMLYKSYLDNFRINTEINL